MVSFTQFYSYVRSSSVTFTRPYITRHIFSGSVCYCSSTTTTTTKQPTPLQKAVNELKKRDPLTGEKRIGKDFNYEMELSSLATRLGHSRMTLPSLPLALTHRSAIPTDSPQEKENLKLILAGKSSLVSCTRRYLKDTYPNLRVYMVDNIIENLTNYANLNKVSRSLGVANLLITHEEPSDELFAKTLLAVIGAVRTDCGYEAVSKLIDNFILPQIKDTLVMQDFLQFRRPQLTLRSILEGQGKPFPITKILKETGRLTHFPTFVIGIYSDGVLIGEGAGTSLKRAQDEAASAALRDHFMSGVKVLKYEKVKTP